MLLPNNVILLISNLKYNNRKPSEIVYIDKLEEDIIRRDFTINTICMDKDGNIVGFDDETAWDTKGFSTPDEYWNDEAVSNLKDRLETMLIKANPNMCSSCDED